MRKIICILLAVLCLFSFSSCNKPEEVTTTDPALQESTLPLTVTVTFPEGYTVVQIAELLKQNNVCDAAEFIRISNDFSYLKSLGYSFIEGIDEYAKRPFILEGYIFPDTYEFYTNEGAEEALKRFLDNTEAKLTDEYKAQALMNGYSMDEIITIASIIQEEASEHEYMPGVSSVLHNRLKSDDFWSLQCDVTINYINDYVKDSPFINAKVSEVSESYNTYECYGLPVGPICNPGVHAIEAALSPPETNYFFFVTDADWNYYYAETYEEHQVNCEKAGLYD